MAAYSVNQKKYVMKYMKENLDEIKIRVPKNSDYPKEAIKSFAENHGYTMTGFIIEAIIEKIKHMELEK